VKAKRVVPLAVSLLAAACGSPARLSVPEGLWGGRNAELQVSATGATATFKCGDSGVISQALVLDDAGRFQATGTYQPRLVLGGPRPAQYTGALNGSSLTLAVSLPGSALGPFTLTQDAAASFEPCNYS
jgi:hypothetical protein